MRSLMKMPAGAQASFLALCLVAAACGGSGGNSSHATVTLTSPQSGTSVALGSDAAQSVPVNFTLTGFTLKAPGTCAGASGCGHLHLVIDDASSPCNASAGVGTDRYNAQIISGTSGEAKFALCGNGAVGMHSITLELADDAHDLLRDAAGNVIASTATNITTHL